MLSNSMKFARTVAACLCAGGLIAIASTVGGAQSPQLSSARRADPGGDGDVRPADDGSGAGEEDGPLRYLENFDPREHEADGDHRVAPLSGGRRAVLTLHPSLQAHVERRFAQYEVPFGAVVAIAPDTGRVLAYVSHSSRNPGAGDLARDPTPPTASVFKVITASALIDAGVTPRERVCYHGGSSRLELGDLRDNQRRDRWCATLSDALGRSLNAVFAKLADRHLNPATLGRYASAFAFGEGLPFDAPTRPSPAEVPTDRLEFARTAAGFWHMHMSPLHGALIGATIANGGEMPRAAIIDHIQDPDGTVVYRHEPSIYRRVIPRRTARLTGQMMQRTVSHGTSRSTFFDAEGNAFLPNIAVAGKTGTLTGSDPYRGYSWWVGFAPADDPTIAVAALVVNDPQWRIKASYMARETLRHYLIDAPRAERRRQAAQAAAEATP